MIWVTPGRGPGKHVQRPHGQCMQTGLAMIRQPPLFLIVLFVWLVVEYAAFSIVVHFIGIFGALCLDLLMTLVGVSVLRRIGRWASRHLKDALAGKEIPSGKMLDGMLSTLGAILLILPGFVSDLAGLALAAPSLRQFLADRFGGSTPARQVQPDIIDLSPEDWRAVENPKTPGLKRIRRAKTSN